MRIRFWGTRGSLPVSMTAAAVRGKVVEALTAGRGHRLDTREAIERFVDDQLAFAVAGTFGGDTSCVEIRAGTREHVLCDLGTGARAFGNHVLARDGARTPNTFHVFMSHVHWDHIMGFPFFMPAYLPGNRVRIYGCHPFLEEVFRRQNAAPCFPVDFARMEADIQFITLEPEREYHVAGLRVRAKRQRHSGDSYGYRVEGAGQSVVYSTDSEHKMDDPSETAGFVDFFREADLVIFDSQYSLADAVSVKEDWGHSSNVVGVELCQMARAKHLCLFHHEPVFDDTMIGQVLQETRRLEEITRGDHQLRISVAYDGMEITL
jgi:phosphoribosyl 1,2-cyclic phosphodiesterase